MTTVNIPLSACLRRQAGCFCCPLVSVPLTTADKLFISITMLNGYPIYKIFFREYAWDIGVTCVICRSRTNRKSELRAIR